MFLVVPEDEPCEMKCCEGPEQVFYFTCGKNLPLVLTLSELKTAVRVWFAPGTTFDETPRIGTRWQGWPQTA